MSKEFRPIPKIDGGFLCNSCRVIIRDFNNEDEAQGKYGPVFCNSCLEKFVNNYKTKNKEGFTSAEEHNLIKLFPTINMDKYYDAMMGNTCMIIDGEIITYHCDIVTALKCGLEYRNIKLSEWD